LNIIREFWNNRGKRRQDRDLSYLLQLGRKHNLLPRALYSSVVASWTRRRAKCGNLVIEVRSRGEQSSTYLFYADGREVAQARLRDESVKKLVDLPQEFSTLFDADGKWRQPPNNVFGAESVIGDLRFGSKAVSFKANVIGKSESRAVTSRTGRPLLVCQVTLSDGTGEIPLTIWNDQVPTISKGDLVQIQNAAVRSFRGQKQLMLNRKTGTMTILKSVNNRRARNQTILVGNRS